MIWEFSNTIARVISSLWGKSPSVLWKVRAIVAFCAVVGNIVEQRKGSIAWRALVMSCDAYITFESKSIICKPSSYDTLLRATYAIPAANVVLRDTTTSFNVIPCTLWMVAAHPNFRGNCFLIIFLPCKLSSTGDILTECFGIVFVVVNLEICFFPRLRMVKSNINGFDNVVRTFF